MSTIYWRLESTLKRWILFFSGICTRPLCRLVWCWSSVVTRTTTPPGLTGLNVSVPTLLPMTFCVTGEIQNPARFFYSRVKLKQRLVVAFKTTHSCRYLGGTTCKELCLMWRIWAQIWPDLATQPCSCLCHQPIETQQVWPVVIYFWRGVSWESTSMYSSSAL